ncbi:hypothetical protein LCGC14_0611650 [marine sediment metagenome]|uniref:Uncharacterized protein n=1 Tax=marine sediment metagenome TaxID=412755 RepID=A0A0F9TTR5_9ZZZZ|nr:hypothetical protein [Methylophaga sp.]HEC59194.1 hypothetical protein [Methylophaga sp.]
MERQYWIRSKPVYTSLLWHEKATAHLVIAEGDGGMAVLKLLQQKYPTQQVNGFFVKSPNALKNYADIISSLAPAEFKVFGNTTEALNSLKITLADCCMGTCFYVAGSEGFIWQVAKVLASVGVQDDDIDKELCGTLARTVYCVHCKAITHDAHHSVVACSGCQRQLFIRDHFSRRLGAYMGLMVDAEQPGILPSIEEVYP